MIWKLKHNLNYLKILDMVWTSRYKTEKVLNIKQKIFDIKNKRNTKYKMQQ